MMLFHLERERVLSIPVIEATNRVTFLDWGSIAECLTPVQSNDVNLGSFIGLNWTMIPTKQIILSTLGL